MMDALTLEVAGAVGCIAVAMAARYRKPVIRPSATPPVMPVARSIRQLRRRHRRAVWAIVELAQECLERHPDASFETFTVREALRTYLPETLSCYLAVPRALRRDRRAGQPSADDELSRQLLVLRRGLERVREADAELGEARMAANGAFLKQRFGAAECSRPSTRSLIGESAAVIETAFRRS